MSNYITEDWVDDTVDLKTNSSFEKTFNQIKLHFSTRVTLLNEEHRKLLQESINKKKKDI